MSAFRSRREMNAAIDALPPPHPATDPAVPSTAPPATPGEALRWAAKRIAARLVVTEVSGHAAVALLNVWASDLDAAPAAPTTYALPAEPPEGAQLCDKRGVWWVRDRNLWHEVTEVNPPMVRFWWQLVAAGPLSTVPPAGTEAQ